MLHKEISLHGNAAFFDITYFACTYLGQEKGKATRTSYKLQVKLQRFASAVLLTVRDNGAVSCVARPRLARRAALQHEIKGSPPNQE